MKRAKKVTSWVLAFLMLTTQILFVGGYQTGSLVAEAAENDTFTLYCYSESSDPLYVNIWNWAGVGFSANATTSTDWGWAHPQAVMQAVDGQANWYSTEITILDSSANDGFDIYQGGSDSANKIAAYDNQWNNTSDYATLVSKGSDAYAVKAGTLYTDLSAAGLDLSSGEDNYQLTITPSAASVETGDTVTLTAKVTNNGTQITNLADAGLHLYWWDNTNNSVDWLTGYHASDDSTLTVTYAPQSAGTFEIQAKVQDGSWQDLALKKCSITVTAPSTAVSGELNVTRVDNLAENFIMGMDISSVISLFDSGVTFKDWNGRTIRNVTDFCKFLASNGITHIRVRVWNDPYNSVTGKGYGGGNNDVAKAKQIADACEAAGIHVMVDFHCSDLWTDPGKQFAPKAWKNYTVAQKATALTAFIQNSLNTIDPNKNTVDMVQVGNETTSGFIGEKDVTDMCTLFSAGSAGVKAFNSSTKVVIHVTNPEKGNVTKWAKNLSDNSVDYDIIATSYYPYWHGTLANIKSEFQAVQNTYGKDVMVAETSYAYTLEDSDGHGNTVRVGNNDDFTQTNCTEPFTVQGQATSIRNLIHTVNEAGGLGVFYWEPAWLTVGDTTGLTEDAYDRQVEANRIKWETYGSGWAASHATEYDPNDAGKWYGGTAVDNEAMFYPDGTPTAGLRVWEYVKTGAVSSVVSVEGITNPEEAVFQGGSYTLPATVSVAYSTGTVEDPVTWTANASEQIDTASVNTYIVHGTVRFSKAVTSGQYKGKTSAPVTYTLTVKAKNLIEDADDAGFEKGSNFSIAGTGIKAIPSTENPYAGKCMSWWNASAAEGTVTYNPEITLEAGEYVFEALAEGAESVVTLQILDAEGSVLYESAGVAMEGWKVWKTPKVTFTLTETTTVKLRVAVAMQDDGWGSADELFLHEAAEGGVVNVGSPAVDPPSNPSSSSGSSSGSSQGGTSGATVTKNPDGTSTTTTVSTTVNSVGKEIEVTTSVNKTEDGSVTGSKTVTVIANPAKNTSAVVTVEKNADGSIKEAAADVIKTGTDEAKGTKVTVSSAVTKQIKEAAGTESVMITTTVTDGRGEEKYTVTVNSKDLDTGKKLTVVAVDPKTDKYVLVNAKTYQVNEKGNVTVTLPDGKDYVLLNSKDAKAVSDEILKTVKAKNSSKTVKEGKNTTIKLSDKLNMDNVEKITYTSSDKSKATVDKNGKITTKKKGTVTIKAKVTLKNGKTKTVSMKVKIK